MASSNMRSCHILRANKTSETPQRACWISIECDTIQHDNETTYTLRLGTIICGVRDARSAEWTIKMHNFTSRGECMYLIEQHTVSKKRTYVVVQRSARTIAILDVFTELFDRRWTCTLAVLESPPFIARFRKDRKTLTWIDIANILKIDREQHVTGVAASHATCGNSNCNTTSPADCATCTAKRLMNATVQWWTFLKNNDLGGFSPTAGAQAMRIFRHRYMHDRILIDSNEAALNLARQSLRGGRTEVLANGHHQGPIYHVDSNSAYGGAMHDMFVPVRLRTYATRISPGDVRACCNDYVIVLDADIQDDQPVYAMRGNFGLSACTGRFRGQLAGAEVVDAVRRGTIVKVHSAAIYHGAVAFRPFIDAMWGRRYNAIKTGNDADALKYKHLIASFFGKWAQSGRVWEKIADANDGSCKTWIDVQYQTKEITQFRQFGGIIQEGKREAESRESHPAIAACITAEMRMQLWRWMACAGLDHVYYVDTDALIVDQVGFDRLHQYLKPEALGGLRLHAVYDSFQAHAKKDYTADGIRHCKGVRADGIFTDAHTVHQRLEPGLAAYVRSGGFSQVIERSVTKKLSV